MTENEQRDGFRIEIDPARERADIVLDRPPLNVITMPQREQLRAAFEAFDADDRIRIVVVRGMGEHFSSGGEIRGFLEASPEQRTELLTRISQNEMSPKKPEEIFFRELKTRTARAYYTSKIGIHTEMEYKGNTYLKEFVGYDAT